MNNIFENAYFGKAYKTRGGDKALFQYKDDCHAHLFTEAESIDVYLDGTIDSRFFDTNSDIVSEWEEEINEDEYENKIKSLIDSCIYWEAYEDEPELFAEAFKELLDFAPSDKRTIDYCADMIKSRKTIFNEVNKAITSFISPKPKEISEEDLDKLAEEYRNKEYVSNFYDPISADYKKEGFKAGYRKAIEILK